MGGGSVQTGGSARLGVAQLRLGVGLNWGGSVETGGRARLGVAQLRLVEG